MSTAGLLRGYLRRHLRPVLAGILCLTLCNLFELVQPRIWKGVVDALTEGTATPSIILTGAGLLVAAGLGRSTFSFIQRSLLIGNSRRIEYDMRNDFFRSLQRLPPSYYALTRTGDLMSRATSDINAVRMVLGLGVMLIVDTLNLLGVSVFFMWSASPLLTGIALAPLLLLPPLVVRFTRVIHRRYEAVQAQLSVLSAFVQENLSGVRVVKAFVQEAAQVAGFRRLSEQYNRLAMREVAVEAPFNPVLGFCGGLSEVLALAAGGWLVVQGRLGLGDFVAFYGYLAIATGPMAGFGIILTLWQKGSASMGRIREVLDQVPGIADAPGAAPLDPVRGALSFRGLTVIHPGTDRPVLEGVSLEIPAGAFIGIAGTVGSGKSTLLHAVSRLLKVPDGQLLLDGRDVNRITLSSLRGAAALVPQDPFLFSDTIRNNIAFGRPEATDGEVARAARLAGIEGEILAFQDGFSQRIGERGVMLSGGQRQRLAIARALLAEPRILLLDNCLSSVDAESEAGILAALRGYLAGRTALVVSHRVSALRGADRILVLDGGRIVEQGTHAELASAGGEYAWLCRRQALEAELERA